MYKNNLICIVQARLSSKRYPNKVLKKIIGKTVLEIINNRLRKSKYINQIIFAIPNNKKNEKLKYYLKRKKINFEQGPENNVLKRFYTVIKKHKPQNIVRITSDCPLILPTMIDKMFIAFKQGQYDYISNTVPQTFPDGFDIEIFKSECILKALKFHLTKYDLEHVTPFIRGYKEFKKKNYYSSHKKKFSKLKLSLDTHEDFMKIKKIFCFYKKIHINEKQIFKFISKNYNFYNL